MPNGRIINSCGYVLLYMPKHPNTDMNGYVKEHRLIMEKYLDRLLDNEEVIHHKNRDKTDNRLENLKLFINHSEHLKYHHKIGKFKNGGKK